MGAPIIGDALLVGAGGGGAGSIPSFGAEVGPGTTPPPGDGQIVWDASPQNTAGNIYVSAIDSKGKNVKEALLEYPRTKDIFNIRDKVDSNIYQKWELTSITDNGTYVTYGVTLVEDNGGDLTGQLVFGFDLKFDQHALHVNVGAEINGITNKATIDAADVFVIESASDAFAKRKVTGAALTGLVGGPVFQWGNLVANQPAGNHPASALIAGAKETTGAAALNNLGANSVTIGSEWGNAVRGAQGDDSIAVGRNSLAARNESIAIGVGADANTVGAVALGFGATTSSAGGAGVAIGQNSFAGANSGIAIGGNGCKSGTSGIAIGWGITLTGLFGIGIGQQAEGTGVNAIAIGAFSDATAQGATAIGAHNGVGNGARALGVASIALGSDDGIGTSPIARNAHCIAMGQDADAGGVAVGLTHAIAIGQGARAVNARSIAIGTVSSAEGADMVVIGPQAGATGAVSFQSVIIGHLAGQGNNTERVVAIGHNARALQAFTTVVGAETRATTIGGIAIGFAAESLATRAIAIGDNMDNGIENTILMRGFHIVAPEDNTGANLDRQAGTNSVVSSQVIDATKAVGDTQNSGNVDGGAVYQITGASDGDFANVGAPNNNTGTYFRATNNLIPTSYGTASLTLVHNFAGQFPANTTFLNDRVDVINENITFDGAQMFYRTGTGDDAGGGDDDYYTAISQMAASKTAPDQREKNDSLLNEDGTQWISFDVTTASTHSQHTVRVFFEGKLKTT